SEFFLVVNASKTAEDFEWLTGRAGEGIIVENQSDEFGAIALQGPDSVSIWEKIGADVVGLPPRNGIIERGDGVIVCRTGYTGEDGFELFAPTAAIGGWFSKFVEAGAKPCGLGARDTLRLEKCYPLNGSDLDERHTPLEAGLGFFVKLEKGCEFPGSEVLRKQKSQGLTHRLVALQTVGKAPPPRHDYPVYEREASEADQPVAFLTSGGFSPSLQHGIALAYLPVELAKPGTELEIGVRAKRFPAVVVKKPFLA
ncbi:MAG: glycine cleavage system protein T, partial [Verrucomicrobiales bacterium]|nr:glycine cleavage system protein T [Verrucomicrobiales bacterium]